MAIVTEEDWNLWRNRHITKAFFKVLSLERERVKELMVTGQYEQNERAIGIAKALQDVLDMDYETFREEVYGERKRDTSEGT